ncbi:MAG: STAS domain-containing protein [bacterium]|nr:STAS domain-containing protein [bacterium]
MSKEFSIESLDSLGKTKVIKVTGRLEAVTAQELRDYCQDLHKVGHQHLVLDLSGIAFIASSGVGTLLALTEEFSREGGGLYLTAVSPAAIAVIRLLNLERFLAIYATPEEAVSILH